MSITKQKKSIFDSNTNTDIYNPIYFHMHLYTASISSLVIFGERYILLFILVFMKKESDSVLFREGYGYGKCRVYLVHIENL